MNSITVRRLAVTCVVIALGLLQMVRISSAESAQSATGRQVLVLQINGPIGPAIAEYVLDGIATAEQRDANLLLIQLDTPGGLDTSMRSMIKAILASKVPVAVYVAPEGARAASAGTYLLYAAHIAAMAPATNTGSATPVQLGGAPGLPEQPDKPPQPQPDNQKADQQKSKGEDTAADKSAMERKVENDAAAYIRSLAEFRGRNADWAEQAVRKGANLAATEALQQKVIDLIADNVAGLLAAVDGRKVKMASGDEQVLNTAGATIEYLRPDWRTRFLSVITDPNIAYMLLLLGFYGLIYEFLHPGLFVPGVIGGICMLLALYALQVLPINYAGLALMLLGITFMVAEAMTPSFGILGIGGVVAFVFGSVILLDEKGYSISLPLILGNAIVAAGFFIWLLGMVMRIRKRPVVSGREQMLGYLAEVSDDFDQEGYVSLMGERWKAVSTAPLRKGQKVKVTAIDGLILRVEPE